jgi:hypothetical protein
MSETAAQTNLPVFGELLAELRARGFGIGLDHYLRVQTLVERLGAEERSDEEWASLLAPLLCRSQAEQEQFHRIFQTYARAQPPPAAAPPELPQPAKPARPPGFRNEIIIVFGVLALVALLVFLFRPGRKNPEQPQDGPAVAETAAPAPESAPDTSQPLPPNVTRRPHRGYYVAALLAPAALGLLYEWFRRRRRQLALAAHAERQPPYEWPLRASPRALECYDAEPLYAAARALRRRQSDERERLDLEASVAATIEAGGFPTLRRRATSKVPEYLLLIERAAPRDHLARLFDALAQALEREGVFLARYFFDGDPRVCADAHSGESVLIGDLHSRFAAHRLLVFGAGDNLTDPVTGRLYEWTQIFDLWEQRVWLTPESVKSWGLREAALAQTFTLLPASLNGLAELTEQFESHLSPEPQTLPGGDTGPDFGPSTDGSPAEVGELRRRLPRTLFQWLCACAVFPELHWELTLQLAALAGEPDELLTETNLLALCRLSWFRAGRIPDAARWELLREIDVELERDTRRFVIALLENSPPPAGSRAEAAQQLHLATQKWRLEPSPQRLRELLLLLQRLPAAYAENDATLARWLAPKSWRLEDTRARLRELAGRLPRLAAPRVPGAFNLLQALRNVKLPPYSLEPRTVALASVLLMGVSLLVVRALAPRRVTEVAKNVATTTPTPDAFPTPDPFATPEMFPTPDFNAPLPPPPLPTPFVSNPAPIPLSSVAPPPQAGPILPSLDPKASPSGSPALLPLPTATPTPKPTPVTEPRVFLALSQPQVCQSDRAAIEITATAIDFAAKPTFMLRTSAGKTADAAASRNHAQISSSSSAAFAQPFVWDLSQLPPGVYTASVEVSQGEVKRFATTTVQVVLCEIGVAALPCPAGEVSSETLGLTALYNPPANAAAPAFNWKTSAGKIVKGNGSPSISLDLRGAEGQTVTATVEVGGDAANAKACSFQVSKTLAKLVDEFEAYATSEELNARLANYAGEVKRDPKATALVVIYEGLDAATGQPVNAKQLADYIHLALTATGGLDAKRLTFRTAPSPDGKFRVRLMAAPAP